MAELNVDPAELLRHAGSYDELAARAQLISPQAAAEVQRVADTHGPIGAPVAAGLAAGMTKADGPVNAKAADFQTYSRRFTEHATAYTSQDSEAAARMKATTADDQIVGPSDPKGPKFDPVDNKFKTGGGQPPPPPAPPIRPNDLGGLLGAPPPAPGAPHGGPMPPTPTSLPKPLQDFINNQLHGKPMPPMTGPPVDVDTLRARILEQQREWEEYERLHPDLTGVNTEGIAASLLEMSGGDLALLAGIVGAPETLTVSFWLGLGAWFLGQMAGAVGIGSSFH